MGGYLTTDPVAALIPGTNTLQLFYRGGDNGLWTRWLTDGTWSDEVGMGGVLNGDPVTAAPATAVSPLSWMSQLSDSAKLSELTLPSTHESCTAFITPIASAQAWSLQTQLEHGIRYIDIRCRHIQDIFAIHHDEVYVGFNSARAFVTSASTSSKPTRANALSCKSSTSTSTTRITT